MKKLLVGLLLITGCKTGFVKGTCFEDTDQLEQLNIKVVVEDIEDSNYLIKMKLKVGIMAYDVKRLVDKTKFERDINKALADKSIRTCK